MYFKYLLCLVLVARSAVASGDTHDEDQDWDRKELVRMRTRIAYKMNHMENTLNGSFEDLKAFLNETFGRRLAHIESLVESLEHRELKAELCTPGICGEHGSCDLSEDWQSIVCECVEGYTGDHCEIEAVCETDLKQAKQQPLMLGMFIPQCTEDGLYAPLQMTGAHLTCYAPDGTKLADYSVHVAEADGMDCLCALDKYAWHLEGGKEGVKTFNCEPNGNYPLALFT